MIGRKKRRRSLVPVLHGPIALRSRLWVQKQWGRRMKTNSRYRTGAFIRKTG